MIDAAAAAAASKLTGRFTAILFGAVTLLTAIGGAGLYFVNQQIRSTAEDIVSREFAERGNEIFGFVALQRRFSDTKRDISLRLSEISEEISFAEFAGEATNEELQELEQGVREALDHASSELSVFAANLTGTASEAETFEELISYQITSGDRAFMEGELMTMYVDVAHFARDRSYYEPTVDLYLAAPRLAIRSEPFAINFAYASMMTLMSDPFLAGASREDGQLSELYQGNQDALRVLSEWPEFRYLFGVLIEAERGASNEQLAGIAAPMEMLSDIDFQSMIQTIAEIGYDSHASASYRLAGERTIATLTRGCGEEFIPSSVCGVLFGMYDIRQYFVYSDADEVSAFSVGGMAALSPDAASWSVGIGGRVEPARTEKPKTTKERYLSKIVQP